MAPVASVLFPTRRRRPYLAVALASVAAQAAAHRAEIIVVEDDAADAETEALAAAHGARYLALGAPQGINAARNAAFAAARGELLCLLDDDVEAWPGWLGDLLAGAAAHPGHEAFGGPIRPRLEGTNLHACGREPPPVTSLDLGSHDRDVELVWGANLALRRTALERIGPFDPGLGGAGDEEDWLRRLRAASGRVRYLARAGVDHRRAGADARLLALSRAAYRRGRFSRRYDVRKAVAPGLGAEARVLAGCGWHTLRYGCGNGIALAAHSAGRLRELLAPAAPAPPPQPRAGEPDFVSGESGTLGRRTRAQGLVRDLAADALTLPARVRLARAARNAPPRREVAVICIERPQHAALAAAARRELSRSRHAVDLQVVAPAPGVGKWQTVNAALAARGSLSGADWLVLLDDDVVLPRGFLDGFLFCCERFGFRLAQPAHAFASHAAWRVTRRRPRALARRTRFVEIGPVTALHHETFATLLPFPDLQMGWGLDAHWAAVAAQREWPVGVVDLLPVRHVKPVAAAYPRASALAEAEAFLATRPYVSRSQAQRTLTVHRAWR